jgi:hypothetical protein
VDAELAMWLMHEAQFNKLLPATKRRGRQPRGLKHDLFGWFDNLRRKSFILPFNKEKSSSLPSILVLS